MKIGRLHVISTEDPEPASAERVLSKGAPTFQLRVKDGSDRERHRVAVEIAAICASHDTPLIVNDRVDLALATDAAGVHLGADDLPVPVARRLLGPNRIIGTTARTPDSARKAEQEGANYLGVGPAYRTNTKQGLPPPLGPDLIGEIAASVSIPVIAIGGISLTRVPELMARGVHGIGVVGAVWSASEPALAAQRLLAAVEDGS